MKAFDCYGDSLLFFFSVPMVAGSLFQQLYNMVDSTAVISRFFGAGKIRDMKVTASSAIWWSIPTGWAVGFLFSALRVRSGKWMAKRLVED